MRALANEALVMAMQQPNLGLDPSELCCRRVLKAFSERRSGDRERVDQVGLPALADDGAGLP
jgi:hypothetical protein